MVSGTRAQGVRLNPRFTLEVTEGMSIADAIANADALGGDWAILLYADTYNEGDITPTGAANITLRGMGDRRVTIVPAVLPATATIVHSAAAELVLENVTVDAFNNTVPALAISANTCYLRDSAVNGVGVGDAIVMTNGTLIMQDSQVPIGDIDLSANACILVIDDCDINGTLDTAGAVNHDIRCVDTDFDDQAINLLATGATVTHFEGCHHMGLITDTGVGGTGHICRSHAGGGLTISGTNTWASDNTELSSIDIAAGATLAVFGGFVFQCTGDLGTTTWQEPESSIWHVIAGMNPVTTLAAIGVGDTIIIGQGTFALAAQLARAIDDVRIICSGLGTRFTLDGVTAVISAGVQDGWLLADFDTDAGGVDIASATNSTLHNVTKNGLHVTMINPDEGVTNFPGQAVVRTEEDRPVNPAIDVIRKDYTQREYQLYNPRFATPQFIMELLTRQARYMHVPINDLWTDNSGGTGSSALYPQYAELACAAAGGDHGLVYCRAPFLNSYVDTTVWDRVDFDNRIMIAFDVSRDAGTHADLRARVQLKQANGEGVLANDGLGIQIQNFAIYGEAFAGAQGTVDLGVTMVATYTYRIKIILVPNVGVYFYVNEVYRGVITAQIPTGPAAGTCYWVLSMDNGAQDVACVLRVSPISYWDKL